MSTIIAGHAQSTHTLEARCPICTQVNRDRDICRHMRWTFDQGGPLDFARFALESSPYIRGAGGKARDITTKWLEEHGDWIVDRVALRFDAVDGYVFGELSSLDNLARDIWQAYHPAPERSAIARIDPS
jgi:hypothetical protein